MTQRSRRQRLRHLLALAALSLFSVLSGVHADTPRQARGFSAFAPGRILNGATPHRLLHFTFDDGPAAQTTPALLDALDAAGVKATFFFSASRFADHSQRNAEAHALALEVARRGHAIGSHSFDHKRMRGMTEAQLRSQIEHSDRMFTELFSSRTYLFRPPWGSHSPQLDRLLAAADITTVLWNIGSADWTIFDAAKLRASFARALAYLQREKGWGGGIVLMHDTHPWTVAAFPGIVADLRAKNCELLAKHEELYDIADDLSLWDPALEPAALEAELARRQEKLRQQTQQRCAAAAK